MKKPYPDGTRSYLMLLNITPPAGEIDKYPLEMLAQKLLGGVKVRRDDWQQSAAERGLISGLTFVRVNWSGTDRATGQKMRGFTYIAKNGARIVQISSQQIVAHATDLAIAETATQTFQRAR